MRVFAISDLHLSLAKPKTMDIFGARWKNHWNKISAAWRATVKEEDAVLIAGDLSWAMHYEEALPDLQEICRLPGTKVLIKGNHDFWHGSLNKTRALLTNRTFLLQNDCVSLGTCVVAGSRGWKQRSDADFAAQDEKLYLRELERMRLSLNSAQKTGLPIIGMTHYPPYDGQKVSSEVTRLFASYGVKLLIYGHIHGEAFAHMDYSDAEIDGMRVCLTSCDYLGFAPRLLVEYPTD